MTYSDIQNMVSYFVQVIGFTLVPILSIAFMGKLLQPKADHR